MKMLPQSFRSPLIIAAVAGLFAACADETPLTPETKPMAAPQRTMQSDEQTAIATLRLVSARYQDLETAKRDDFVLLHECEARPGEGPVGIVYVNIARLMDGVIDVNLLDALIYAPTSNGRPKLAGVEFALPYGFSPNQRPSFLGNAFQDEDEFGVYALHAWVWLENPNGMFEETNPRITCGTN